MSKLSNLVTAGIFIIFLAVLFHYFCRVRKKPMLFQQQVQVPESYVYPITPNVPNHQSMMGPSYGQMHSPFGMNPNVPYPVNVTMNSGLPYSYPYPTISNNGPTGPAQLPAYPSYPQIHNQARPNQQPRDDDLPPPYHVAVASGMDFPK